MARPRPKPPLRAVAVVAACGVVLIFAGFVAAIELAALGLILVLAAPVLLLVPSIREPPERRYDSIGDDMAAMIERIGSESRPRRPRDPDR